MINMTKKICRLCLGTAPICFSLLKDNNGRMLESLTSIKVNEDDEISTVSCTKCLLNVKLAFNIQQNIIKIDEKLRNNHLNDKEIKKEICEVMLEERDETLQTTQSEPLEICDNVCKICGISIDDNMMNHIQEHFQSVQECNSCNQHFKNIHEYCQHLLNCQQTTDDKKDSYTCVKCASKFRYESLYNLHMKNHENDDDMGDNDNQAVGDGDNNESDDDEDSETTEKLINGQYFRVVIDDKISYRCNVCLRVYRSRKQFVKHTHDRKKCPICNADVTVSNWKKHVSNHSSGPQICEVCGATLRSLESLRGHMTHTHSTQRYKCEECNLTFKVHYNYLKHRKSHTGVKDHICDQCGRGFITKHYLNKHIKLKHLKLRPHICEFCKRGFSSKNALSTHRRQHTNETPYRCEVCGEGFRQNVSLRTHRKSKHNIIEPKTCACEVCGKLFSSRQAIHSHMRLH